MIRCAVQGFCAVSVPRPWRDQVLVGDLSRRRGGTGWVEMGTATEASWLLTGCGPRPLLKPLRLG